MKEYNLTFVQEMKRKLDVELVGVVSVDLSGSREIKERVNPLLPGTKSVVVFGKEIYGEIVSLLKPSKEAGEGEPGGLLLTHSEYLNGRLNRALHEMAEVLRRDGHRCLPLTAVSPTDQRHLKGLLSYKHVAEIAGLGTIGRHSLLITPEFGPRLRLACLLTEASIEPSSMKKENYCLDCERCIRECPAQALQVPSKGESYSMNKFACNVYRMAGLTCNVCMKVCDEILATRQ